MRACGRLRGRRRMLAGAYTAEGAAALVGVAAVGDAAAAAPRAAGVRGPQPLGALGGPTLAPIPLPRPLAVAAATRQAAAAAVVALASPARWWWCSAGWRLWCTEWGCGGSPNTAKNTCRSRREVGSAAMG